MRSTKLFVLATLVVATTSCGDAIRQSTAPVSLVVDSFQGVAGQLTGNGTASGTLLSDVIEYVATPDPCSAALRNCPTVIDDFGTMTLRIVAKDVFVAPSANNEVTVTRYHVKYTRADGRNTPGVDVPYEFDGAVTATIAVGAASSISFELVRHAAKEEPPLVQLISNPTIINTIAEVTVYGTDRVGNAISATATMSIEFGNFGDK